MPLGILQMCCDWKENAKQEYLICITHIAGVSLCLTGISAGPCPISLFSFKFGLIVHINALQSAEMSTRMQANLYKRLTTTYQCLTIATDRECLRTPQGCLPTPTNFFRLLWIGA